MIYHNTMQVCFYFLTAVVCFVLMSVIESDPLKIVALLTAIYAMEVLKEDFLYTDDEETDET